MSSTQKLAKFLRPYRKSAIIAPLLMTLEVTMDLMQPRLIQQIVDLGIIPIPLHRLGNMFCHPHK